MIALDLFAGTGWGVACQKLGIEEHGVELMPEAIATRKLNGMTTLYADVWTGLEAPPAERWGEWEAVVRRDYDLLIASPPCQTFSMAGGGAGRKALDDVLGLIDVKAYRSVEDLRAFGESHDPRTALVLTPLAHVFRDLPRYVVFEQVPPVLPVWERCAEEMRAWGYSVWTGNLQAEMYGVPQTRKRAILIAKRDPDLDGEAAPPTPTHSRYYSRDPKRLDEGVLPWVSMAEALGWGEGDALRSNQSVAGIGRAMRNAEDPALTMTQTTRSMQHVVAAKERGAWAHAGAGSAAEKTAGQIPRPDDSPAHTVTGKGNGVWVPADRPAPTVTGGGAATGGAERVTVAEAAALQSYPPGFTFAGTKTKQFLQVGNAVPPLLAEAILRAVIS